MVYFFFVYPSLIVCFPRTTDLFEPLRHNAAAGFIEMLIKLRKKYLAAMCNDLSLPPVLKRMPGEAESSGKFFGEKL